jgi:uncharacterized protein YceK
MVRQCIVSVYILLLTSSVSGCMTIVTLKFHPEKKELPLVFSGTRACLDYFEKKHENPEEVDPHGHIWLFGCGLPFPFNVIADIVTLPITLPWAVYEMATGVNKESEKDGERGL